MSTGKIRPGVLCILVNCVMEDNLGKLVEVVRADPASPEYWLIRMLGGKGPTNRGVLMNEAFGHQSWLRPIDGLTDDEIAHIKAGEPTPAQRVEGDKVPA